ncbi:MAG: hypothetical protein KKF10_08920 [Verrucomicrobia bacterium]|nr:hypothetical protein [Verrucomicrobiota bacterium]
MYPPATLSVALRAGNEECRIKNAEGYKRQTEGSYDNSIIRWFDDLWNLDYESTN